MARGDNVKKYWEEVKKKAGQDNKGVWDVVNPMMTVILKNPITINSIVYQGTVRVKPDLAQTLRYIDEKAEEQKKGLELRGW